MKKAFHMKWRTMTNGVPEDGTFVVHMTQEQWESPDKVGLVNVELAKLGLTTKPFPPADTTMCVVSENKPKRSAVHHRAIVNAIQQSNAVLGALDGKWFYERYASLFDQLHRLNGSVTVNGSEFYFRYFASVGMCEYAEKLEIEASVTN